MLVFAELPIFVQNIYIWTKVIYKKIWELQLLKFSSYADFYYLLYMEGAMPPNDRSPTFVKKKNRIEPKDIRTKFD